MLRSSLLASSAGRTMAQRSSPLITSLSAQLSGLRIAATTTTTTTTTTSSSSSSFHTSAAANAKVSRYVKSLRRVQKHFARQLQKPKPEDVDPVLGRSNVPFIERMKAALVESDNLAFGLTTTEAEKIVFGAEYASTIRTATSSTISTSQGPISGAGSSSFGVSSDLADASLQVSGSAAGSSAFSGLAIKTKEDAAKREAILRIVSMQNSSLDSRKKFAVDFAVKEFSRFEGDTGSSEVQAAVATIKIHFLVTHLKENKKDLRSKRTLQQLISDRQGILKYLRRAHPKRYYWAIEKLGLNDAAITNEFNLSGRYFEKYQFFGPNTLSIRDSKKERMAKIKYARMEKKAQKFLAATGSSRK
ncbi:mitochondrial 37S ribosomal protein uS15m [Magnusiomyces paraingens]|uniref:Ribosomal protein S15 n=1 Tax=Magnusiomyces paraingens TaxID=2606893 RepID=A0A5E8BKE8_9ASCO|nr:uncharacterized protein SAPINGB_P002966 [Saprochaete ingens]VVT51047.1 unnamed protein product [Saprochaete ingens]